MRGLAAALAASVTWGAERGALHRVSDPEARCLDGTSPVPEPRAA